MYKYEDIRNFYFENETGKRIDCQKINGNLFLYNVTGLGYEEELEYERIGNTFVRNDKKILQNQISGDLEFYDMTYDEYCNFINFILASETLRLIYIPKNSNRVEYYRDIDFCKIDKTEEDDFNVLTSPIIINCKSLWYKENTAIYDLSEQEDELTWDFKWDSRFAANDSRSMDYINKGHVESPIEIEISGPLINPVIQLYVEGKLYQQVPLNIEIQEYEKILYGSKENDFYIRKENTDGTLESLFNLDVIDFANDNVIRLPKNKSCKLRIRAENEITNAKIIIYTYYKAV